MECKICFSDPHRQMNEGVRDAAPEFMNLLLLNLQSPLLDRHVKPSILSTFGDVAIAIGGDFESFLPNLMVILDEVIAKTSLPPGVSSDIIIDRNTLSDLSLRCYRLLLHLKRLTSSILCVRVFLRLMLELLRV